MTRREMCQVLVLTLVSSFPGFRVKLIDFSRRELTLISSFPGFRVKLIEFSWKVLFENALFL